VTAYLMYSKNLDREAALEVVRNVRDVEYVFAYRALQRRGDLYDNARPNEGFMRQLELFQKARFQVSRRDKSTRMFYMERALGEVMSACLMFWLRHRLMNRDSDLRSYRHRWRWHSFTNRHVCKISPDALEFESQHPGKRPSSSDKM
jgi:hypothetical protein